MKIATFNANSLRSRLGIVIDWLKKNRPDALCIQETKVQDSEFPSMAFIEAGYHAVFRGEKSYNGVAVLSLEKPRELSFGFNDGKQADETRLLYARIGSVRIVNTYVPQGRDIDHEMYRYKQEWLHRLREYFDRHFTPRMRVLWLGDMNVAPEKIDIHNAEKQHNHVCFHRDIRDAFTNAVKWGFVDVFRKHHPEPGQYTFFDYRTVNAVKKRMGWRVDHIMATKSLAAKSTGAFIDLEPRMMEKPSDHTFLAAEFDI